MDMTWAIEGALNPTVLRLHVTQELTAATILTCPPAPAPEPLDLLVSIEGVRSLDLQRYRVRLNLVPGAGRATVMAEVAQILHEPWGGAAPMPPEELPRAFAIERQGARLVAEGKEMAERDPVLERAFSVEGVAEAIVDEHLVLVRLGRLFRWADVEPLMSAALTAPFA
jgi:hypothetical protein